MANEVAMASAEVVALLTETTAFVCEEWALPLSAVLEHWDEALERNICRRIAPSYLSRRWIGELDLNWWAALFRGDYAPSTR
jgi:hypothetical protein